MGCRYCDFDPADYGHDGSLPIKLGRYGPYFTLLSCERCSTSVCSIDAEMGPVHGYGSDEWFGKVLCPDCVRAVNDEAAARWESEHGDSGMENPYVDAEATG